MESLEKFANFVGMEETVKNGNGFPNDATKFSSDNKPSPEAKKLGWQELRKQRHLTQSIIAHMIGKDGKPKKAFKDYLDSLVKNARMGNPKAIETINKGLEDIEVVKSETIFKIGKDLADEIYK